MALRVVTVDDDLEMQGDVRAVLDGRYVGPGDTLTFRGDWVPGVDVATYEFADGISLPGVVQPADPWFTTSAPLDPITGLSKALRPPAIGHSQNSVLSFTFTGRKGLGKLWARTSSEYSDGLVLWAGTDISDETGQDLYSWGGVQDESEWGVLHVADGPNTFTLEWVKDQSVNWADDTAYVYRVEVPIPLTPVVVYNPGDVVFHDGLAWVLVDGDGLDEPGVSAQWSGGSPRPAPGFRGAWQPPAVDTYEFQYDNNHGAAYSNRGITLPNADFWFNSWYTTLPTSPVDPTTGLAVAFRPWTAMDGNSIELKFTIPDGRAGTGQMWVRTSSAASDVLELRNGAGDLIATPPTRSGVETQSSIWPFTVVDGVNEFELRFTRDAAGGDGDNTVYIYRVVLPVTPEGGHYRPGDIVIHDGSAWILVSGRGETEPAAGSAEWSTGPKGADGVDGADGADGADSVVPGPAGQSGMFAPVRYTSGHWYGPTHYSGATHNGGMLIKALYAMPFWVSKTTAFDRIGCWVVDTSSTGVARLGIYANHSTLDYPGALLLDAGTVNNASSLGAKELTISQTLNPGLYWLVLRPEASGFTAPRLSGGNPFIGGPTLASVIAGYNAFAIDTTASATLPATYPASATLTTAPKVMLRVAP
jgi:hypothetical protein